MPSVNYSGLRSDETILKIFLVDHRKNLKQLTLLERASFTQNVYSAQDLTGIKYTPGFVAQRLCQQGHNRKQHFAYNTSG